MDWREGWLRMIQAHDIYCSPYFYYYYISSTSDHQALDLGDWGPLLYSSHLKKIPISHMKIKICKGRITN